MAKLTLQEPPPTHAVKDWVDTVTTTTRLRHQDRLIGFALPVFALLLLVTVIFIFLQGFHLWGFHLDQDFLKWLGISTVGEVGGLLGILYGAVFGKIEHRPGRKNGKRLDTLP